MRSTLLVLMTLSLLITTSCKKKKYEKVPPVTLDIHMTGGFAGFNSHYKLSGGVAYQDTSDYSYTHPGEYLWSKTLPQDKYDKVKDILYSIPRQMYIDGSKTYGQSMDSIPDGMSIWATAEKDGKKYTWIIGTDAPGYAAGFGNKISQAITDLRQ
jgi:hypothetical protein